MKLLFPLLLSLCTNTNHHLGGGLLLANAGDMDDAEFVGHIDVTPDENGNFPNLDEDAIKAAQSGQQVPKKPPSPKEIEKKCIRLATDGKCDEDENVRTMCAPVCERWDAQQKIAPRTILVDIDREDFSFFDLSAKLEYEKTWVDFNRFEGYLTVVANIGKLCETNEDINQVIMAMSNLFNVMPYSLNIVIFPFQPPGVSYLSANCDKFDEAVKIASTDKKLKSKLFIMETAELNGADTHPVYKYLKEKAELEPMLDTHSSFFFVNGEGTKIDLFQAASFTQLRGHIVELTRSEF